MRTFPRLRKAVELENARECIEWKRAVRTPGENQAEKISRWLTPYMEKKFKAGTISLETAQKFAIKRIEVEFDKRLTQSIEKIDRAENAQELLSIDILVEWKKNRTWGMNPIAKVRAWTGPVSYTHLRAHETPEHLVCRLLLEKKKNTKNKET